MNNRHKIVRAVLREIGVHAEPDLRRLLEAVRVNDPRIDELVDDMYRRYPRCEELEAQYARIARRNACEQVIRKARKQLHENPEAEAVITEGELQLNQIGDTPFESQIQELEATVARMRSHLRPHPEPSLQPSPGSEPPAAVTELSGQAAGHPSPLLAGNDHRSHLMRFGRQILEDGYWPVPIAKGQKRPMISDWQNTRATLADLDRWPCMLPAGIGVGVLAFNAPGIDVDVLDENVAAAMREIIEGILGGPFAYRIGKAPKFLVACRSDDPFSKITSRKFRSPDGAEHRVEILADGQQYVVAAVHPDTGRPYRWHYPEGRSSESLDVPRDSLLMLTREKAAKIVAAFEALVDLVWAEVAAGTEFRTPIRALAESDRQLLYADVTQQTVDDLRSALAAIPSDDRDLWVRMGQALKQLGEPGYELWIEWSQKSEKFDAHDAERVWASLSGDRTGLAAVFAEASRNWTWKNPRSKASMDLSHAAEVAVQRSLVLPAFKRDKWGAIKAVIDNVIMAVERPDICGLKLGFDTFRDEIMVTRPGVDEWRPFTDADYVILRQILERDRHFKSIPRELLRDAVLKVAHELVFDSAIKWLEEVVPAWDGTPRVENFLRDYFGAEDTSYTRAVSRYWWTAHAGRVLVPGIKADMVPVLVGAQGIRKTSGVWAVVPGPEHAVEITLDDVRDADQARLLRGRVIGEIAELRGLRTRDAESIKSFISRTHENWIPKYREFATTFARRLVFVGTTNVEEFLDDETGNRRWLPVQVTRGDNQAIERDRMQLWAEAREMFKTGGIEYAKAEALAVEEHAAFQVEDPWRETIAQWLVSPAVLPGAEGLPDLGAPSDPANPGTTRLHGDHPFTIADVLTGALDLKEGQLTQAAKIRAAKVLQSLGYARMPKQKVNGVMTRPWGRKVPQPELECDLA